MARKPLALLLIDLDHFKSINDKYGHPFGDLCLQRAAAAMAHEIRDSKDLLARYGGEEFALLLGNTDVAGAVVVAERLLASMHAMELTHQGKHVPVTCSIGVTSLVPAAADRSARLVNEADKALYRAKRDGRNQVASFQKSSFATVRRLTG